MKTFWEKEKILVTSISSIVSKTKVTILATLELSSANAFTLVKAKILLFGKELKRSGCRDYSPDFDPSFSKSISTPVYDLKNLVFEVRLIKTKQKKKRLFSISAQF